MITSQGNAKVKEVVLLREKKRERDQKGLFVTEGIKIFFEVPVSLVKELYIEETLFEQGTEDEFSKSLPEWFSQKVDDCRKQGAFIETVSLEVMKKMADTKTPQGVLMVVNQLSYDGKKLIEEATIRRAEGKRPLFLLLEDIQDPGNLGTMIRTAEGAGADGIFMTKNTVDIYNPKTIRATMGSLYRVPFVYVDGLGDVIDTLREQRIVTYAAHLKGEKYYHEMDYHEGSAFLIGNEGNGLTEETANLADTYLKIPMEGKLESLNAGVAAALLMYQSRQ